MPKRVRPASDGGSADTNEDLAQLLDNSERGPSKRLQHNPTTSSSGHDVGVQAFDVTSPIEPKISRKIKACNACRKQKVKCLVSDENDRCRRCSKRNLTCVISKNLQTIIDEKTCFQDRVMNDLKEICSAIRQLQKLSNVSQLPPLQVSSDKAVALEKPSAALSPRPTTPPSTAGHGEGSISPIDGSAENAAVDDGRAHESNGGPETSPSAYYPPPESLSPIHLSHEEPFFQENGTMENDTYEGRTCPANIIDCWNRSSVDPPSSTFTFKSCQDCLVRDATTTSYDTSSQFTVGMPYWTLKKQEDPSLGRQRELNMIGTVATRGYLGLPVLQQLMTSHNCRSGVLGIPQHLCT